MIVMKFGGTSNKDAAAMANVIRIVRSHREERPVVVISAIAKATNELEESARAASAGDAQRAELLLDQLFARHADIIRGLLTSRRHADELTTAFATYHAELRKLVQGVAILRELTARTMDAFCSFGERLSSRIVAAGLAEAGVDAAWVDVRDFMVTDDNFGRAMPLTAEVTANLERVVRPLLVSGTVPVTQGFIGVTTAGLYTTMGRESSDYSASIIGAAMNADRVQIWTDVDGILTADPRLVTGVKKVKRMSFGEAFELSYFGAKVLHPNTMLPLLEKDIPVEIRNSRREEGTGTLIDRPSPTATSSSQVKSIAFKPDVTVLTVSPRIRLNQYLFWEGIFSVLTRQGINVGTMSTSEYSVAFTVDNRHDAESLAPQLEQFGRVVVLGGKGSICIVGSAVRGAAGLLNRVFDALSGVNISMIAYGASELNITIVLDSHQLQSALGRLHTEFFGGRYDEGVFDDPKN
jgi:aspartate kinase